MSCRFSECAWAQACPGAERFFDGLLNAYTRVLDFVLGHQRATLMTFIASVATTVALYVIEPKGFFPQQDTGIIAGLADTSQDVSFGEMVRIQHQLTDVISRDPDVASWATTGVALSAGVVATRAPAAVERADRSGHRE
jgi:multidrug efflux pump subunit AcrB